MAAASITPYMLKKVKGSDLKELIFTAKIFYGNEAVRYGLVNQSFSIVEELELHLNTIVIQMLANGPHALIASKQLINRLAAPVSAEELEKIPELLARIRVSPEAREGFSAFLGKRKPKW